MAIKRKIYEKFGVKNEKELNAKSVYLNSSDKGYEYRIKGKLASKDSWSAFRKEVNKAATSERMKAVVAANKEKKAAEERVKKEEQDNDNRHREIARKAIEESKRQNAQSYKEKNPEDEERRTQERRDSLDKAEQRRNDEFKKANQKKESDKKNNVGGEGINPSYFSNEIQLERERLNQSRAELVSMMSGYSDKKLIVKTNALYKRFDNIEFDMSVLMNDIGKTVQKKHINKWQTLIKRIVLLDASLEQFYSSLSSFITDAPQAPEEKVDNRQPKFDNSAQIKRGLELEGLIREKLKKKRRFDKQYHPGLKVLGNALGFTGGFRNERALVGLATAIPKGIVNSFRGDKGKSIEQLQEELSDNKFEQKKANLNERMRRTKEYNDSLGKVDNTVNNASSTNNTNNFSENESNFSENNESNNSSTGNNYSENSNTNNTNLRNVKNSNGVFGRMFGRMFGRKPDLDRTDDKDQVAKEVQYSNEILTDILKVLKSNKKKGLFGDDEDNKEGSGSTGKSESGLGGFLGGTLAGGATALASLLLSPEVLAVAIPAVIGGVGAWWLNHRNEEETEKTRKSQIFSSVGEKFPGISDSKPETTSWNKSSGPTGYVFGKLMETIDPSRTRSQKENLAVLIKRRQEAGLHGHPQWGMGNIDPKKYGVSNIDSAQLAVEYDPKWGQNGASGSWGKDTTATMQATPIQNLDGVQDSSKDWDNRFDDMQKFLLGDFVDKLGGAIADSLSGGNGSNPSFTPRVNIFGGN